MKNILNKLIVLLLITLAIPQVGFSQDNNSNDFTYQVNRVLPYISITEAKLNKAQTLIDIDKNYKSSWVKEYKSVEILTSHQGKVKKAIGPNNILTQEQKDNMSMADVATDITVKVHYLPENNLKNNDIKMMDFTFTVDPHNEAKYVDGKEDMLQYVKEKAIDNIPDGLITGYALAAVKFTVNEEGKIINPHIFESTNDENIDKLLVQTVQGMNWTPAEYADGTKVKQDFVLTVGNMKSCVVNLLSIGKLSSDF